jgi:hypothetical protein
MAPTYHSGRKPHGAKRKKPVDTTLLSVLLIMVVFAYIYHGLQPENASNPGEPNASVGSITTDKGIYHSGEGMSLNVSVNKGETENLSVRVYGVQDRMGNYRISDQMPITQGMKEADFSFKMPPCYGCAGVSPGNYTIICELLSNGTVVANATKIVELAA